MRVVEPLPRLLYEPLVRAALSEDFGLGGDLTSEATVPAGTRATALLVARRPGVLAGLEPALLAFRLLDPGVSHRRTRRRRRRPRTQSDDRRARRRRARVARSGTDCAQLALARERHRDRDGGVRRGRRRRAVRDLRNAQDAARSARCSRNTPSAPAAGRTTAFASTTQSSSRTTISPRPAASGERFPRARERAGHLVKIEIEVDNLAQLDEVLQRIDSVDAVLLDNFSPADLRTAVRTIGGRLVVEASGGITLENIAEVAATGVDIISIGALTHSVRALDIGLDFALEPERQLYARSESVRSGSRRREARSVVRRRRALLRMHASCWRARNKRSTTIRRSCLGASAIYDALLAFRVDHRDYACPRSTRSATWRRPTWSSSMTTRRIASRAMATAPIATAPIATAPSASAPSATARIPQS